MKINLVPIAIMISLFTFDCYGQHDHSHGGQNSQTIEKDKDRWYWQLPNKVIKEIGITEGMVIADVGAGDGYFTIPIAQKVGATGCVYASDIDSHALSILKEKSEKHRLNNIQIVMGTENNPRLPIGQFDIVLIVNTIHLIKDLNSVLYYVKTSLKPNGLLVIIQWDSEKMSVEHEFEWDAADKNKYSLRTTLTRIYEANFEVAKILTFLPMQNIFICLPKDT